MNYTNDQKQVIDHRKGDLLVTAAAGSGKTAVLTEHIVNRVKEGVSLDELLVLTFTNAAAASMKEKIRGRLAQALKEEPDNELLKKQQAILPHAHISTIHHFCLTLLKTYFHELGLDASFKVGDTGELALLEDEVVEQVIEEAYAEKKAEFLEVVSLFGGRKRGETLRELLKKLRRFIGSFPSFSEAEEIILKGYDTTQSPYWMKAYEENVKQKLSGIAEGFDKLADILEKNDLYPEKYSKTYRERAREVEALLEGKEGLYALASALDSFTLGNKPVARGLKESAQEKALRDRNEKRLWGDGREEIQKLKKRLNTETVEDLELSCQVIKKHAEVLLLLVKRFEERFGEEKRSRNLVDFEDMEHMACRLLYNEDKTCSAIADELAQSFTEILVDEYQDSSLIQERILTALSARRFNRPDLFMVGDVKQSIYSFRQARPDIFLEKENRFSFEGNEQEKKIALSKNFRSRKEVLAAINDLFSRLMRKEVGGICYDEKAALHPGLPFPERKDTESARMKVFVGVHKGGGFEKEEQEAAMIANQIEELIKPGSGALVTEGEGFRPVRLGDIAILLRSGKKRQEAIMAELLNRGIPVIAEQSGGYFDAYEVKIVLHYLSLLDNPLQDIPLCAILHSPMYGWTMEDLARLKLSEKDAGSYYEKLKVKREAGDEKATAFLTQFEHFRKLSLCVSLSELLEQLLKETGYLYYEAASPGGEVREANLYALIHKARNFEKSTLTGLYQFVSYIEKLQKYEGHEEESPKVAREDTDAVHLMTIHKSKGLEFPVVIVAGLDHHFNELETREEIILHPLAGMALPVGLSSVGIKRKVLLHEAFKEIIREDIREEELRLFYVALTRAREYLILTGMVKDEEGEKTPEELLAPLWQVQAGKMLPVSDITGADCFLDWVMLALSQKGAEEGLLLDLQSGEYYWPEAGEEGKRRISLTLVSEICRAEKANEPGEGIVFTEEEQQEIAREAAKIRERRSFVYPHREATTHPAAMSVSQLKGEQNQNRKTTGPEKPQVVFTDEESIEGIPNGVSGAERGTAYHLLMEELVKSGALFAEDKPAVVKTVIEALQREEKLSVAEAGSIDISQILAFFSCALAEELKEAAALKQLFLEKEVLLGLTLKELSHGEDEEDLVMVQGRLDGYGKGRDGWFVLDYKTDRVKNPKELVERYKKQLNLYGRAIEEITGEKVKHLYLYSFALGKSIEVK